MNTRNYSVPDEITEQVLVRVYLLAESLSTQAQEMADSLGLSTSRLEVLFLLGLRGQLIQRDIAYHLDCTPRQVTALVDNLSASGHVSRVTPANDRRRKVVQLTEKGRVLVDELQAGRNQMARELFGSQDPDDVAVFLRVTDAAIESMGIRKTAEPQVGPTQKAV